MTEAAVVVYVAAWFATVAMLVRRIRQNLQHRRAIVRLLP